MLFFTGLARSSSEVAKAQVENIPKKEKELSTLSQMVDEALAILNRKSPGLADFGKLLHESWKHKKSLSDRVSTPEIDEIYESALAAGAVGGKILGAGGGGFFLLFVPPERQGGVREKLKRLIHVPFRFEPMGSRIVLYHPNGLQ